MWFFLGLSFGMKHPNERKVTVSIKKHRRELRYSVKKLKKPEA
jgi:hypothetical protein